MDVFILNGILWTFAIYGIIEIIKKVIQKNIFSCNEFDGTYLLLAVKNQQNTVENFLRKLIFKVLYANDINIDKILIVDLDSNDDTLKILKIMENDYDIIKVFDKNEFLEWVES